MAGPGSSPGWVISDYIGPLVVDLVAAGTVHRASHTQRFRQRPHARPFDQLNRRQSDPVRSRRRTDRPPRTAMRIDPLRARGIHPELRAMPRRCTRRVEHQLHQWVDTGSAMHLDQRPVVALPLGTRPRLEINRVGVREKRAPETGGVVPEFALGAAVRDSSGRCDATRRLHRDPPAANEFPTKDGWLAGLGGWMVAIEPLPPWGNGDDGTRGVIGRSRLPVLPRTARRNSTVRAG